MVDVGNLKTRISLDSAQFEQSMAGVNRQLKGLKQEQKAVTSSGTGFARGVDELRGKSDVLTRTLKVQDAQVKELKRRYDESREATGENSKETQNANTAYQKAKAEMNKTENALKGITTEIERQTNPWNVLSDNMDDAGKKLQDVGGKMTDFGKSYSMRVTAPILALGVGALKAGMDFEAGMSQVQALTQGTAEEMSLMSDQAKELGKTTRFSATEAAEGMAFLGMAGWDTQEIISGMPGLLDLAAASNMELGRAADITSNIMAAFNIEAEEAGRVSDILAHASSNSNTNVEQLGEAMKYVAPTANTLGLSIEDTAAAIMSVSDAGIQGSQAGRAFGTSLLRLADPTKDMKEEMDKLKVSFFDNEGAMKPLPSILEQLEKGMAGYDDEQRAASLSTLFGTEAQRHWAIMLDTGSEALGKNSKELENSEGAAQRMADTMSDNAKGKIIEFKSALEGIGIALSEHMIPAVTDAVEWGTDLVRKFGELDDGTQEIIVKMGLFAAAIGPAAIIMGGMTTATGNMLRAGSGLVGMLGTKSGAGLIGRVSLMGGPAGPVILAAGAIGLLGTALYLAHKDGKKLHDVSTETSDKLMEQANDLEQLVQRYDELESSSKLTNDQFGRMIDIQKDLEQTQNPARIAELKDEYEYLREKSGLTNDEINEMIGLNNDLIEQSPNVEKSFTDKGNAVVESTDAVKEYINSLKEMAFIELQAEMAKALENEAALRNENKEINEEIAQIEKDINELVEMRNIPLEEVDARLEEINKKLQSGQLTQEEYNELEREQDLLLQLQNGKLTEALEGLQEQRNELLKKKELNEDEIAKLEQIKESMAEMLLSEVDINWEKGEGLKKLDETIQKLKDERAEIMKNMTEEERINGVHDKYLEGLDQSISKHEEVKNQIKDETGYQSEHNKKIDEQNIKLANAGLQYIDNEGNVKKVTVAQEETNKKIEAGVTKAFDLTQELRKEATKKVKVDDDGTAKKVTDEATKAVTKKVSLNASWLNLGSVMAKASGAARGVVPAYADGTSSHPGGLALVGEEGFELARHGSAWSMLGHGITNLPRGTEVFTHDESKSILRAINNMPAYAGGISSPGEASRVVGGLNSTSGDYEMITVLKEQNELLLALVKKDNVAYVEFEKVYQPVKKRLAEDQYSNHKRRR